MAATPSPLADAQPARATIRPARWRRGGWWALLLGVALLHLLLLGRLADNRIGWGAGDHAPARLAVAFVRTLQAAAPPEAAPPPAAAPATAPHLPAVAKAAARPAKPAASAPDDASDGPVMVQAPTVPDDLPLPAIPPTPPTPPVPPFRPDLAARTAAADVASAVQAPSAPAAASASPAAPARPASAVVAVPAPAASAATASFDWPPSTRLSYVLNGYYRGPVTGSAQVEWLRQGERYQVRMGTSIGPVLSRNIVSEGVLTPQGLAPQRFSGEQKVLFRAAKRWGFQFEPERVLVQEDGSSLPSLPGVQDEASQFVQLTWLFTTQPQRLRVGQSIEVPLIVSRRLNRWIYDVVAEEVLHFPFGDVPTFHVKPRREAGGGDLTAEMWIAPTLQYLPVRILIRQNAESSADLTLERAPEQAAR